MERAIPAKLPDLTRLRCDLARARRMEACAEQRYRDHDNRRDTGKTSTARRRFNDTNHLLYKRFSAWRDKRQAIEGQIEQRIARDAEVQRIFDAAGATR